MRNARGTLHEKRNWLHEVHFFTTAVGKGGKMKCVKERGGGRERYSSPFKMMERKGEKAKKMKRETRAKSGRIGTTVCLLREGRMTLQKATNRSMSKPHEIDGEKWRERERSQLSETWMKRELYK